VSTDHRRPYWVLAALSGALSIILGAFGAHALGHRLSAEMLNAYQTGVHYQMWQTIALMGLLAGWNSEELPRLTLGCWIIGTLLFSGSLYLLALTNLMPFAFVTPVGGTLLIIGWLTLAWAWWRK